MVSNPTKPPVPGPVTERWPLFTLGPFQVPKLVKGRLNSAAKYTVYLSSVTTQKWLVETLPAIFLSPVISMEALFTPVPSRPTSKRMVEFADSRKGELADAGPRRHGQLNLRPVVKAHGVEPG